MMPVVVVITAVDQSLYDMTKHTNILLSINCIIFIHILYIYTKCLWENFFFFNYFVQVIMKIFVYLNYYIFKYKFQF